MKLSTEQITLLEQLVGTELSPATSIDDVLQLLNNRIAELETQTETLPENPSGSDNELINKIAEIRELEQQLNKHRNGIKPTPN